MGRAMGALGERIMGKRFVRQNGESMLAFRERIAAVQSAERAQREALVYRGRRFRAQREALRSQSDRVADRIDGFDRDDLGESPDY